jgi:phenylacetate-coenzyme A ligase PaaK-like adenylate-forming protein
MEFLNDFKSSLSGIHSGNFNEKALELFRFQAANNAIYQKYLQSLSIDPASIQSICKIPFLPIEFFKNHEIKTGSWQEEQIFMSSGTTGQERSRHFIRDLDFYKTIATRIFEQKYGPLDQYAFLAFLPSYQENSHSSLIFMINHFIEKSPIGSTYISHGKNIGKAVKHALKSEKKVFLWGVSYALLDLAEQYPQDLSSVIIMETGGMKGRGRELPREELHEILTKGLNVTAIHSEYGMTELLSQAYSGKNGIFSPGFTLKVLLRELNDPFSVKTEGRNGGINIIDLANIHSCSFIETKDLGTIYEDNTFEVKGRIDNSEIRGCNLLYAF